MSWSNYESTEILSRLSDFWRMRQSEIELFCRRFDNLEGVRVIAAIDEYKTAGGRTTRFDYREFAPFLDKAGGDSGPLTNRQKAINELRSTIDDGGSVVCPNHGGSPLRGRILDDGIRHEWPNGERSVCVWGAFDEKAILAMMATISLTVPTDLAVAEVGKLTFAEFRALVESDRVPGVSSERLHAVLPTLRKVGVTETANKPPEASTEEPQPF